MIRKLLLFATLCLVVTFVLSLPTSIEVKISDAFPNVSFTFDCSVKPAGLYADMDSNCQYFHVCDELDERNTHLCGNNTGFNQEYRICDASDNFDCSKSADWFHLNEIEKPREAKNGLGSFPTLNPKRQLRK